MSFVFSWSLLSLNFDFGYWLVYFSLMPFHPVETDILSVLATSNLWFKRRKLNLSDFVRARAESRLASQIISEALERIEK